jgi:hypothetical protein
MTLKVVELYWRAAHRRVHYAPIHKSPLREDTESDRMSSNEITNHGRSTRPQRDADGRLFIDLAVPWFCEIAKRDPRHEFLAGAYGFHVVPGGREGADSRQLLEVYYGQRPAEQVTGSQSQSGQRGSSPVPRRMLATEAGAGLRYQKTDHGTVLCLLEPARSQGFERPESLIVLARIKEPRSLTGKPILERHWRSLVSYFEFSSIDGDPGISDRIRVCWLLFTRPLVIDGKAQQPRIIQVGGQILKWVVTIGLGGALLKAVRLF